MKVSKVVKTAVKLAPIIIPIVKKVIAAKKGAPYSFKDSYKK